MRLRPYQSEAVDSVFYYFQERKGNPIIAAPTGTGKSVIIASLIETIYKHYPTQRVMMLTHVKELIEQNFQKLLTLYPTAPAGIYSAGLKRKDLNTKITFAGIASVAKKPELFGHQDLIIIDECHLVSTKGSTMYRKFINALKKVNPHLKVIGLSATPFRLGLGYLTDGDLFTDFCFNNTGMLDFNKLLDEGYLSPLIPQKTKTVINVDNVHIRGGEFIEKELQEATDKEEITRAAVNEMLEQGADRDHWLIFATGIDHAMHVAEYLNEVGVPAAVVHSKMTPEERDLAIFGFKTGTYKALVNNNILTTGFDFPEIDLIGVIRPTNSPVLWVQLLGRGTRPVYAPGFNLDTIEGRLSAMAASCKQNCLVLDFAGNTPRLGPINDPKIPNKKGNRKGTAPVRVCEICNTYNHASARICINCGFEFPREVKITAFASQQELIAKKELPVLEIFEVNRVVYKKHQKMGAPDSIKASYYCGLRLFNQWICIEHPGYAGKKARDFWNQALINKDFEFPETTLEALKRINELKSPTHVRVWVNKKYPEILSYDYQGTAFGTRENLSQNDRGKQVV